MILQVLVWAFLPLAILGCPENPVPPCICRMIGNHSSHITCANADNELQLEKSLLSMRSIKVPIRVVEIFEANVNYLPSEAFKGLKIPKLFIAGSSMVSLTEADTALVGLEDSLEKLQIHECDFLAGWSWSALKNLRSLRELTTVKISNMEVDEDVKEIAHLDLRTVLLTKDSITYVHDTAFSTFHNLRTLSLKANPIKELKRSMFPNPAYYLEQLILSNMGLEHLPSDFFTNMPQLQFISLSDNKLLTVDKTLFLPVWKQLKKIDLRDNPIRCDCRMTWLLDESFPLNTWAKCLEPNQVKDKELKKLVSKDLWC